MEAETPPVGPENPRRRSRSRWRSWLTLGLVSTGLTLVSMAPALPWPSWSLLFTRTEGVSQDTMRLFSEIRKLGGEAHVMERPRRFLGLIGGRDLLHVRFNERAFDDASLARFVNTYGHRLWGLDIRNTGVTDAGMRHLAGLTHVRQLVLGNEDLSGFPGITLPLNTITDAGLVHLKGLTELTSLNLGGLPITDAGLNSLRDLPNLGGLYFDRTQVRGLTLGRLKSLPGLAVLYLDRSAITDEGLGQLKAATNLQVLSLSGTRITGQGLNYLKTLPKLNRLNVQKCQGLSFEELDAFLVACPLITLE